MIFFGACNYGIHDIVLSIYSVIGHLSELPVNHRHSRYPAPACTGHGANQQLHQNADGKQENNTVSTDMSRTTSGAKELKHVTD